MACFAKLVTKILCQKDMAFSSYSKSATIWLDSHAFLLFFSLLFFTLSLFPISGYSAASIPNRNVHIALNKNIDNMNGFAQSQSYYQPKLDRAFIPEYGV